MPAPDEGAHRRRYRARGSGDSVTHMNRYVPVQTC